MNTLQVVVTSEQIGAGIPDSHEGCALALSIQAACPGADVSVHIDYVLINRERWCIEDTEEREDMRDFISDFDREVTVPSGLSFTFTKEV